VHRTPNPVAGKLRPYTKSGHQTKPGIRKRTPCSGANLFTENVEQLVFNHDERIDTDKYG
jgi:hypothetical protein